MSRSAHLVLVGGETRGTPPGSAPSTTQEERARARAMARHPSAARSHHGPGRPPAAGGRSASRHLVVVRP